MADKHDENKAALLSMVLLNDTLAPDGDDLLTQLRHRLPSSDIEPMDAVGDQQMVTSHFYHVDGQRTVVSLMPAPIPWDNLAGPCATAWWWPEAADQLRDHKAHLIIFLFGDDTPVLQRTLQLTQITCACLATSQAAGVYWGSGTLVHAPPVFLDEVAAAQPDNPPVHLWVDMRMEPSAPGEYRFFTTGMTTFGHSEFEVEQVTGDPNELYHFARNLISYVLCGDVRIGDGETIGRSEEEKIEIRHANSMFNRGKVLQFDWT